MSFYNGYQDVMEPKYKLHSYRLGTTTNPTIPDQLREFGKKLNEGVKNIEIGALNIETFESIPKEHLEDIRRWSKMADVNVSLHAPVNAFDPAGFEQGRMWSEEKRKHNEHFLKSVLERATLLSKGEDPKTKKIDVVPVVIHAAAPDTKAINYEKGLKRIKRDKEGNEIHDNQGNLVLEEYPDNLGVRAMRVVNTRTGEVQEIKHDSKYSLRTGKEEVWDIDRKLHSANFSAWDKEKRELAQLHDEILKREQQIENADNKNLQIDEQIRRMREQDEQRFTNQIQDLENRKRQNQVLSNALNNEIGSFRVSLTSHMDELYDDFQRGGDKKGKKALEKLKKDRNDLFNSAAPVLDEGARLKQKERAQTLNDQEKQRLREIERITQQLVQQDRNVTLSALAQLDTPKMIVPINDFAKEKVVETVTNSVMHAYDKFKDKAPMLVVENFWTDTALSRADDLKDTIETARKQVVKKLVAKGVNEKEAKRWADQHLGVTWDIGHISSLRNAGLSDEELKEITKKETRKIGQAGLIRHAHVWDNFGFHSAHLPLGTANIPAEEILEELAKTDFRGRIIEEGGSWINSFKEASFPVVLQKFKAPLYGSEGGPGWNPVAYSAHSDTFIEFPQTHFNLYGSSFATLPKELGGQIGGEKSRFSGTPNQ